MPRFRVTFRDRHTGVVRTTVQLTADSEAAALQITGWPRADERIEVEPLSAPEPTPPPPDAGAGA